MGSDELLDCGPNFFGICLTSEKLHCVFTDYQENVFELISMNPRGSQHIHTVIPSTPCKCFLKIALSSRPF